MDHENLGAADRIVNTLLAHQDHLYHNRPGMVLPDARQIAGQLWLPVTHKVENGQKVVYQLQLVHNRTRRVRAGVLRDDGKILNGGPQPIAEYRPAGVFVEVAAWFYEQIAQVWQLDNEFVARWASFQWPLPHRDIKVLLAAFLLCQSRRGDPVRDGGQIVLYDEDYRDVGEALLLQHEKRTRQAIDALVQQLPVALQPKGDAPTKQAKKIKSKPLDEITLDFSPKMLLRVREVLQVPAVAAINRRLGFGRSARTPFLGRWPTAVEKWLQHREQNPKLLQGLVKAGFRTAVMELAERVGFKPETDQFFDILRWKQKQAKDGRRNVAIGKAVRAAESLAGMTEEQVCQYIVRERPAWKRVATMLPVELGVTRAIMAAAIEAGCVTAKDLIILTPTLEELGLLEVQEIRERWQQATRLAEDMRAANIARNVKTQVVKEQLQQAADTALQAAVAEVVKGLRIYVIVDISGSMHDSLPRAIALLTRFVQGFPLAQLHVSVFNTAGRELTIRHASAAGVEQAFRGLRAEGGTDYRMGIRVLRDHKPQDDEDTLFIFVGDEGNQAGAFAEEVERSGLRPRAFGLVKLESGDSHYQAVTRTAAALQIPCFQIHEDTFADPYAIPRTVQALVAATPVGLRPTTVQTPPRQSLAELILKTQLLQKPTWA